jgi:hypothetical protein
MKRRAFIKIGIALGVAAVAAYFFTSFTGAVKKILRNETDMLQSDPASIDVFITEATNEQFFNTFSRVKKMLITMHTYAGPLSGLLPYRNKYIQYRGQITGQFLLSTDFFTKGMDTSTDVKYKGFYNPYKQPCSNPFSSIYYPETA